MDFLNQTPFRIAAVPGRMGFPGHSLTLIVKGTFDLVPDGPMTPIEEQAFATGDEHYPEDEEGAGSLRYASDFAPFKPKADLLFVGSAHAPDGEPAGDFPVRFRVGAVKHTLSVIADRRWRADGRGLVDAPLEPIASLPLRYEAAFGGPGFAANPVGVGAQPPAPGAAPATPRPLPNIEDRVHLIRSPGDTPAPAGFGPLHPEWALRKGKLGTCDQAWLEKRWPWFPEDLDWTYFNAAPPALQVEGYLRGDEAVRLINLHPGRSDYRTRLPGLRVRCFLTQTPPKPRPPEPDEERTVQLGPAGEDATITVSDRRRRLGDPGAKQRVGAVPGAAAGESDEDGDEEPTVQLGGPREGRDAGTQGARPGFQEVPLVLDTLWVDGDAGQAALVWRGHVPVASEEFEEVRRAFVLAEPLEQPPMTLKDALRRYRDLRAGEAAASEPEAPPEQEAPEVPGPLLTPGERERIDAELKAQGHDEATRAKAFEMLEQTPEQAQAKLQAEVRQAYEQAGLDPDKPPQLTPEQEAEKARLLKAWGFDPDTVAEAERERAERDRPLTREDVLVLLAGGEGLAGRKLAGLDLAGVDFGGADCTGADFSGAKLAQAKLAAAILTGATLDGADLREADLSLANAAEASFKDAPMRGADLTGADLSEATLAGADLTGACLESATAPGAVFAKAVLERVRAAGIDLTGADLSRANLLRAVLDGANLSKADLHRASFHRASLRDAKLHDAHGQRVALTLADLTKLRATGKTRLPGARLAQARGPGSMWVGVDLSGADLAYARFQEADFSKATLCGADLTAADLSRALLVRADLRRAKLVDMNLFAGSLEKADLTEADLSGSNLYGVEFLDAVIADTVASGANIKQTKIENW